MIQPESRTEAWIRHVGEEWRIKDLSLVEKTIRAFSLLEALARSGCPFVFKGGTSLMLHLNSSKRISIDVDIVCPPGTRIEQYLEQYAEEYGFGQVELVQRIQRTDVPKQHAKFYYEVAFRNTDRPDKILLDVLFEELRYEQIVEKEIQSPFLVTGGEAVRVRVPSYMDLLGDKMTAFAPHTTGIPFWKGEKNCSMEIMKQLFDVASLFDLTDDLTVVTTVFKRLAKIELEYRHMDTNDIQAVLDDIFQTSICLSLRGAVEPDEFKMMQDGIKRMTSFVHSEPYNIDSAITSAAKAAYLSKLVEAGETRVEHYDPKRVLELQDVTLCQPLPEKLNKLKKQRQEAFFYWAKIQDLMG